MKNEKKKQKENLRLLRSYSLCACMLFLGGIAFPMPSNASTATELATPAERQADFGYRNR